MTLDLPEGARVHLPISLSDKKAIIENKKMSANELADMVLKAINQINSSSVETLNDLVMKSLKKRKTKK